ncbi:hypothetical protein D3C83_78610 [compost metagenome]
MRGCGIGTVRSSVASPVWPGLSLIGIARIATVFSTSSESVSPSKARCSAKPNWRAVW